MILTCNNHAFRLVVCNDSPLLEPHFQARQRATLKMKAEGRHKPGATHSTCPSASRSGGWGPRQPPLPRAESSRLKRRLDTSGRTSILVETTLDANAVALDSEGNGSYVALKRRRLSSDAKLILGVN